MSKDVEKKKNYERILIEESLKKVGVSATILDQPGPPQPDAIIQINGDQIGLEHTDLFKSENIQALQKFAYKVIDYASECYQGPASSIYPSFETGKTKEKPEDIGQKLAAFVAVASDGIHHNPVWGGKPLPQIKQIRISRYPKELALVQSAWRPELPLRHDGIIEALKKRISDKEDKRSTSYSKQISRNWLLITMQQMQDSQFFHWSPVSFDKAIVSTGFERILLCDLSFGAWCDIPPN